LVKDETAQADNGIYTVTSVGTGTNVVHTSVRLATTAALPAYTNLAGVLTATGYGGLVVDGMPAVIGDRILVKNEATPTNNGIYTVTRPGLGTGTAHAAVKVATNGALPPNTNSGGVLTATG